MEQEREDYAENSLPPPWWEGMQRFLAPTFDLGLYLGWILLLIGVGVTGTIIAPAFGLFSDG